MDNETFDKETILEVERIFFSLEKEYINELLKVPEFHKYLARYFSYSNKNLLALFSRMQEQMENNEISEEDEDMVELSMIACILAMSEKVRILVKKKLPEKEKKEEVTYGRSRK